MHFTRRFTKKETGPYLGMNFESRKSEIREPDGRVIFSQNDVVVPKEWSQVATDVLAQKYFRRTGVKGQTAESTGTGENDARQVFHRLAGCWTDWGKRHGYFSTDDDADTFYDEICYMLANQMAAPNSPQWFNTGLHFAYGINGSGQGHWYVDPSDKALKRSHSAYDRPQPHACFIQSVSDDLVNEDGIMDLWVREARLFKYGSGTGTNFSNVRASGETLSGGGRSSGLMSFLKVGDRAAGSIKSGGTTRRAAKMVCLDLDHPEVEDFIKWKVAEEQKVSALVAGSRAHKKHLKNVLDACFVDDEPKTDPRENETLRLALIDAREANIPDSYLMKTLFLAGMGKRELDFPEFNTDWEGDAYLTVSGQNSNNSLRIPNEFFQALEQKKNWKLRWRTNGKVAKEIPAEKLWSEICYAAWASADPGIQCESTINEWHTCPAEGRIRASNPCSEYMFLDDTACNLASINLLKFYDESSGEFDVVGFSHACRVWTTVLEISVLMAQFPSRAIAQKSFEYRTLGLGYANLGALLMSMGHPYGSPEALAITGALTALMTGESYATSAELAKELGAFEKFSLNRAAMMRVIRNHRRAVSPEASPFEELTIEPARVDRKMAPSNILKAADEAWERALTNGEKFGFRNAQVTVIAPTGTIGLIMDCDTTGIEPDFALVKFKKLSGGGYFRIINQSVPRALRRLGLGETEVSDVVRYVIGHGSLEKAPHVNHRTLLEKGFTIEALKKIDSALPQSFDLSFAVTPWILGHDFCEERLGLDETTLAEHGGNILRAIGFSAGEIEAANRYACGSMTVEGAPHLDSKHYAIFDCANKCGKWGTRFLDVSAHIDMMAAAQPFISGAISKTINMPQEASLKDIESAMLGSWKKMLKAISIYRDGSKLSQPLSASLATSVFASLGEKRHHAVVTEKSSVERDYSRRSVRRELPKRRFGYTVKATIGGQRVYLRTGEYEDGQLGEIFVDMYKEGAAYRSLMNAFSISVSLGLQYGVPLEEYLNKFHMFRFEPNGHVADHDSIKFCSSVIDLIFRDLALNYLGRTDLVHVPPKEEARETRAYISAVSGEMQTVSSTPSEMILEKTDVALSEREWKDDLAFNAKVAKVKGYEGDPCSDCGQFTLVRSGTCLRCVSCGSTSGCS